MEETEPELEIAYWSRIHNHSQKIRKLLQSTDKLPDFIIEDLFEDSKLEEEKCPRRHIRVGPNYQAEIPLIESKYLMKS